MSYMSPLIGEFLIKATHLPDIDAALKKVLTEYIELKTADLWREPAVKNGRQVSCLLTHILSYIMINDDRHDIKLSGK